MSGTHETLSDIHIQSARCRRWVMRASDDDARPWLANAITCPELRRHQIAHLGIADMVAPYRIRRTQLAGAYFLACFGGKGQVLVEGSWRSCGAGQAAMLPPRSLNAFHAVPGVRWKFCWVRFESSRDRQPIFAADCPALAPFDGGGLRLAMLGLREECTGTRHPAALHHWIELIRTYVEQFARPHRSDPRLFALWQAVSADLASPWDGPRLARTAHLSFEHLRRLSRTEIGRSPMHQVIHLRMTRAAELLAATADTVEQIGSSVGYHDPSVFSARFKKWAGLSPTDYRRRLEVRVD